MDYWYDSCRSKGSIKDDPYCGWVGLIAWNTKNKS